MRFGLHRGFRRVAGRHVAHLEDGPRGTIEQDGTCKAITRPRVLYPKQLVGCFQLFHVEGICLPAAAISKSKKQQRSAEEDILTPFGGETGTSLDAKDDVRDVQGSPW